MLRRVQSAVHAAGRSRPTTRADPPFAFTVVGPCAKGRESPSSGRALPSTSSRHAKMLLKGPVKEGMSEARDEGGTNLSSGNDTADAAGDRRFVERVDPGGAGRTSCRPPIASPSSTTTARSGARKPMRSSSGFILMSRRHGEAGTRRCRKKQPLEGRRREDYGWLGEAITEHYHGDETKVKSPDGRACSRHLRARRSRSTRRADAFLAQREHPTLDRPLSIICATPR